MRSRLLIAAALLAAASCASPSAPPPAARCSVSTEDQAWIDSSLSAWRFTAREIAPVAPPPGLQVIFFDDDCVLTSNAAFDGHAVWSAAPHAGMIPLPGGEAPAGVMSFTSADEGRTFFVMATPSVWRAAGVPGDPLGLEALMTAVLLHESSHALQSETYATAIGALSARYGLPDDFNDDSMQEAFGDELAFADSVARETELLFEAAAAPDEESARRLARQAREMMRARADRWFQGEAAYYREAEDLWLTMEGSGQWVAYQWLVHPAGGEVATSEAMAGFGLRGRWWSQKQGLALAFALTRLAPDWPRDAFGAGERTFLEMLDAALAS